VQVVVREVVAVVAMGVFLTPKVEEELVVEDTAL
jgi:hypothetical protein